MAATPSPPGPTWADAGAVPARARNRGQSDDTVKGPRLSACGHPAAEAAISTDKIPVSMEHEQRVYLMERPAFRQQLLYRGPRPGTNANFSPKTLDLPDLSSVN